MNPLKPDGPIVAGVNPSLLHAQHNAARGKVERLMGRSDLVEILENPSKWVRSKDQEQTSAMKLGLLLDCLSTQPEEMPKMFAAEPETYPATVKKGETEERPWNYNANHCKAWRAEQRANGLIEISERELQKANAMADRMRNDADIWQLFKCSAKQVAVPVSYQDLATGIEVKLRCIIDLVPDPSDQRYGDCLADIKTSCDATPHAWERTIASCGYHVQGAFYRDAINAHGFEYRNFLHPVVESEAPHEIARRMLSDEWLREGQIAYQRGLALYCECLNAENWPGFDDMETDLMRPIVNGWRLAQIPAYLIKESQ